VFLGIHTMGTTADCRPVKCERIQYHSDGGGEVGCKYDVDIILRTNTQCGKCHLNNNIIIGYDIVIQCVHLIINSRCLGASGSCVAVFPTAPAGTILNLPFIVVVFRNKNFSTENNYVIILLSLYCCCSYSRPYR